MDDDCGGILLSVVKWQQQYLTGLVNIAKMLAILAGIRHNSSIG
jgi:hypothetical protein